MQAWVKSRIVRETLALIEEKVSVSCGKKKVRGERQCKCLTENRHPPCVRPSMLSRTTTVPSTMRRASFGDSTVLPQPRTDTNSSMFRILPSRCAGENIAVKSFSAHLSSSHPEAIVGEVAFPRRSTTNLVLGGPNAGKIQNTSDNGQTQVQRQLQVHRGPHGSAVPFESSAVQGRRKGCEPGEFVECCLKASGILVSPNSSSAAVRRASRKMMHEGAVRVMAEGAGGRTLLVPGGTVCEGSGHGVWRMWSWPLRARPQRRKPEGGKFKEYTG